MPTPRLEAVVQDDTMPMDDEEELMDDEGILESKRYGNGKRKMRTVLMERRSLQDAAEHPMAGPLVIKLIDMARNEGVPDSLLDLAMRRWHMRVVRNNGTQVMVPVVYEPTRSLDRFETHQSIMSAVNSMVKICKSRGATAPLKAWVDANVFKAWLDATGGVNANNPAPYIRASSTASSAQDKGSRAESATGTSPPGSEFEVEASSLTGRTNLGEIQVVDASGWCAPSSIDDNSPRSSSQQQQQQAQSGAKGSLEGKEGDDEILLTKQTKSLVMNTREKRRRGGSTTTSSNAQLPPPKRGVVQASSSTSQSGPKTRSKRNAVNVIDQRKRAKRLPSSLDEYLVGDTSEGKGRAGTSSSASGIRRTSTRRTSLHSSSSTSEDATRPAPQLRLGAVPASVASQLLVQQRLAMRALANQLNLVSPPFDANARGERLPPRKNVKPNGEHVERRNVILKRSPLWTDAIWSDERVRPHVLRLARKAGVDIGDAVVRDVLRRWRIKLVSHASSQSSTPSATTTTTTTAAPTTTTSTENPTTEKVTVENSESSTSSTITPVPTTTAPTPSTTASATTSAATTTTRITSSSNMPPKGLIDARFYPFRGSPIKLFTVDAARELLHQLQQRVVPFDSFELAGKCVDLIGTVAIPSLRLSGRWEHISRAEVGGEVDEQGRAADEASAVMDPEEATKRVAATVTPREKQLFSFVPDNENKMDPHNTLACFVCKSVEMGQEVIVACDLCDRDFHPKCVGLNGAPEGATFCRDCSQMLKASKGDVSLPLPPTRRWIGSFCSDSSLRRRELMDLQFEYHIKPGDKVLADISGSVVGSNPLSLVRGRLFRPLAPGGGFPIVLRRTVGNQSVPKSSLGKNNKTR